MKILAIIVTYNAMRWAERCFSSLLNSIIAPDIFVVDNGSNDGTQKYIQDNFPDVIFFQSPNNLGFGRANNIGLQYALNNNYDYIYLLNQDAWVLPNTFKELIELSRRNPEYGILSPFQMNADMLHIDKSFNARVCSWKSNNDIFNDLYNQSVKEVYCVNNIMAAHWFLTRECVEKVGGFSPSFIHYGEDDNYADRARYWNFKLGIVPSLRVVHDRGYRMATNEMKIDQVFVDTIVAWSAPIILKKERWKYLFYNIKISIKYKSTKPISNLFHFLYNLNEILRNRKKSMVKQCPFLNVETI